jgi:hypothetical protein
MQRVILVATLMLVSAVAEAGTLFFSTLGSGNAGAVPRLAPPYDDADLYRYSGLGFERVFDASGLSLPTSADVDGVSVVDRDTFYLSFNNQALEIPGFATVQDEDVLLYDAGAWYPYFDGTALGLGTSAGQDLDAISVVEGSLYFSTSGTGAANPVPGVSGPFDDADIYRWTGDTFERVFDATGVLPGSADIDGLTVVDSDTFYLSFNNTALAIAGFQTVFDEDVVMYDAGTWSMFVEGASLGLQASSGQDLDAISVVPTPSVLALLGAGLLGLPSRVRRKAWRRLG